MSDEATPTADPTRVVADPGVLVADLLLGGEARDALDHVRRHSWMTLVASDFLLDVAEGAIGELASPSLATDWRSRIDADTVSVAHPSEDHPALASAYQGGAAHLLTFDEELASAKANRAIQPHMQVSIRSPDAFARLFDAQSLYESVHEDDYPGPDCDPRG